MDLIPAEEGGVVRACEPAKHTGRYTLMDHERAAQIAELFALGRGCKAVARIAGIGVHTARACRNALEAAGKLAPLKKRLSAKAAEILQDGLDVYHEAILNGEIRGDQIPVGMGIIADKKVGWDGEAQTVVEHRSVRAEVSLEELRQMRQRLASDVASGGFVGFAGATGRLQAGDAWTDTAAGHAIEVGGTTEASGGTGSKGGGGGLGGAAGAEVVIGEGRGGAGAKGDA